ncbi:response regulator [Oceanobacillus damuensis]|uniref:response regulator n=1 Tax=Oceanobacillus damuensis TaxID=937928 RepID=UPI00082D73F8|nr:response regulator [Oceanobacillus damuensis]
MKIRTKLLLVLSTLPVLLIILIAIGRYQITNFNEINDALQNNYDLSVVSEAIHRDIKDEAISLRNIILFTDENTIQSEMEKIERYDEQISANIQLLGSTAYTQEQQAIIEDLSDTNLEFNTYKEQLIESINEGNREDALVLMNENSLEIQQDFFDSISLLTDTFESDMFTSLDTAREDFSRNITVESIVLTTVVIFIMILMYRSIWSLTSRLSKVSHAMSNIANGHKDLDTKVEVISNDEIDEVAKSFNQMSESLKEQRNREQDLLWTKTHIADITTNLSGAKTIETLSETFLSNLLPLVEGNHAVFYVKEEEDDNQDSIFKLRASYAFKERKHMTTHFRAGEGLIGQAVLEKSPIILSKVPADYITVKSGLGEAPPLNLYVLPILFEGDVKGVVEISSFQSFNDNQRVLMEELISDLGILLESVMGRIRQAKLLEETQVLMEEIQAQSEELQSQQDELKATNEELEQQTNTLQRSEEKLQIQQEELEQTNTELEEKAKSLAEQNKMFVQKNNELEIARANLEEKAKELAISSKYKSEFLANMSHELRTPLNSMLILSNLLYDNKNKNLSEKQVKYAKTINSSGKDLLTLINDILDLSKIESGKMDVYPSEVPLAALTEFVEANFRPVANDKNLQFNISMEDNMPEFIYSDELKIQQVLKNLLANAFKFTKEGKVTLEIETHHRSGKKPGVIFSVTDTGIGISREDKKVIFDAFQQADGTTSRKFGGTGLGLSISKEIAALLGGTITVESEEEIGSTFSFSISDYEKDTLTDVTASVTETAVAVESSDKRSDSPIITMNEPVYTASKEINGHIKRLLLVDDDLNQRNSLMELVGEMDVIIKAVSTGKEALEELKGNPFDFMILDLGLSDTTGFDLLDEIMENQAYENLKVFVYTGRDLTTKEEYHLNQHAHTIIIKDEQSPHRLKEELELHLNIEADDDDVPEQPSEEAIQDSIALDGKKVLLVDDDIRNVFALTSALEHYGMDITFAENGREGLEALQSNPDIDLVLMDIMMPEMDGYEAMRRIREIPAFINLPIIVLTAKAMNEDRLNCLEAGASDYIVKPVDTDQLISLIKVWLFQQEGIVLA